MKIIVYALAALLLIVGATAAWQHHRIGSLAADLAKSNATVATMGFELSTAAITPDVITHYVDRLQVIHDGTTTLHREIPLHVTFSIDHDFPLPVGFVRMHDSAATGVPPDPAGPADAIASPVKASAAASVIADNYGACRENSQQMIDLQDWLVRTAAKMNDPKGTLQAVP